MHTVSTFQNIKCYGYFSNNLCLKIDVLTNLWDVVETKKMAIRPKEHSFIQDIPEDALKTWRLYKVLKFEEK